VKNCIQLVQSTHKITRKLYGTAENSKVQNLQF